MTKNNHTTRIQPHFCGPKKKLLALVLMLLFAEVVPAQTTSKEINNIKRNQIYIYAESTMATEAEARDVANELLMKQIEEYISSKRKLTNADNVIIKNISTKSESMTMMRGTMYRVFVYVKKSDIEGVNNTTVINAKSGTTTSITDKPSSNALATNTTPSTTSATVDIPESEIAIEMTPDEIADIDIPDATQPVQPTSEAEKAPVTKANPDPAPTSATKEPTAASDAKTAAPLGGWKQDAINSLLKCENLADFRTRLNRLKAEYKIKSYGTIDRCPSVANSFWAIFDEKGKLVTILGNGTSERIDYRTMTMSSLEAHKGMNALWFNFAK